PTFPEDGNFVTWHHRLASIVLAAVVVAVALAAAAAFRRLTAFTGALASSSLALSLLVMWLLFHGDNVRGTVLLGLAVVYVAAAATVTRLGRHDLAVLLVALGLFCVAFATAMFLSHGGLLVAWALEGVMFVALARRANRPWYQAAGFVYLLIAA